MTEHTKVGAFPKKNLTLIEWFIKHKVSSHHMSLDMAINKALNSLEEI